MRKTCNQSKNDNPNWGEKLQTECSIRNTFNITECFVGDPKVVKFRDDLIVNSSGLNMAYSSIGMNK
jgi:hypothetical protein